MGLQLAPASAAVPAAASPPGPPGPVARAAHDGIRIALFLLIVFTISRIHQHFPMLAKLRPMSLMVLCAFGYAYLNPKRLVPVREWSKTWPARVVMALGILACCSVLFGISMGRAGRFVLEEYSKVIIMTFLLMATVRTMRDLKLYVWAYVIACGLLAYLSLFVFGLEKAGPDGIYRLANLYTYDANDVCVVLLPGLALALFTFETSSKWGKLASAIIIIGVGATLARTGSRGGFLGLMALGVAFVMMPSRTALVKRLALAAVVGFSLSLGSADGYWKQMKTVFFPTKDYNWTSPTGRRMAAKRGFEYMRIYPIFGLGINNFPMAEGTISNRARDWRPGMAGIRWMVPHNSYVQAGAEMGYPGLVLWFVLATGGIVTCVRLRTRLKGLARKGDRQQREAFALVERLPIALVGYATSAAFVSFAYMDAIYVLATYVCGVIIVTKPWTRAPKAAAVPATTSGRRVRSR